MRASSEFLFQYTGAHVKDMIGLVWLCALIVMNPTELVTGLPAKKDGYRKMYRQITTSLIENMKNF